MSFLVQIPLSALPAIYEIKGIKTKINWTLCVAVLLSNRVQYHSPLLSVPNSCWDPCNPDGITVSSSPAQKSSAVQLSGAEGKAISSEDVPEQLWMPYNILQLPQFWAALSQHSHHAVSARHPSFTGETGGKPISLGSSLQKELVRDKNKVSLRDLPGPWTETFILCLLTASWLWLWKREPKGRQRCQRCPRCGSEEALALLWVLVTPSDSDLSVPCPHQACLSGLFRMLGARAQGTGTRGGTALPGG